MSSARLSLWGPHQVWRRHHIVGSGDQLSVGERSVDRSRSGMGSQALVIGATVVLAGSMIANRDAGFDPYPFVSLNLVLSCVAASQGAISSITTRWSERLAELAAHHDNGRDAADGARSLQASGAMNVRGLAQPSIGPTADGSGPVVDG